MTTTDTRPAWKIYANVLELLATTSIVSLLISGLGLALAGLLYDGELIAVVLALWAGALVWPFMFWGRSSRVFRESQD